MLLDRRLKDGDRWVPRNHAQRVSGDQADIGGSSAMNGADETGIRSEKDSEQDWSWIRAKSRKQE